ESYVEETTQTVIDNINLLYVAFTRAEEQLYVFSPADKEGELNTAGKLISRVARQQQVWTHHDEEENFFVAGEPMVHPAADQTSKTISIPLKSYPSNRWQGRISITTHAGDLAETIQSSGSSKTDYGILVHKILSEINSEDEIEKNIAKYYFEGLISEEEKIKLQEEISGLLLVPEIRELFSNEMEVKSEREIILPGGEIIRPDRVLVRDGHAIVIDFKTGKELPSHAAQVTRYADVLLSMNYRSVKKYLLYVNDKKIKAVD
ncbi:MAG: PD-(D/E)XK nuclease family protein, partial [Bacteroidetes bacterium]|nr:PD-(D/E)XK nuclease family protein [Bacteroidota bacterium]